MNPRLANHRHSAFSLSCAVIIAAFILHSSFFAQSVPTLINYQGQIADGSGMPLPTADYTITFNIYDVAQSGNLIWGPQVFDGQGGQGHGPKIPVVQGYFNVMLGPTDASGRSLTNAFNAPFRYVEIAVSSRPPMLPRQQILSAPYAFKAGSADSLAGYDWSALFDNGNPQTGNIPGGRILSGSLTSAQMGDGQITAAKIASGAVIESKLATSAISTRTLADGAVITAKVSDAQITSSKLADGAITAQKLAGAIIGSNEIVDGSISSQDIAPGAITTAKISDGAVSQAKMSARPASASPSPLGSFATNGFSTYFSTSAPGPTGIPGLNVTLTVSSRPVLISLTAMSPNADSYVGVLGGGQNNFRILLLRDGTVISKYVLVLATANGYMDLPPSIVHCVDFPPAGQHTYEVQVQQGTAVTTFECANVRIVAFEL